MSCSRQVHGLIASLSAIIIGILQLALERSVLSHFQHRLAKHSTAWPPHQQHPSEVKPLALVPESLVTTPTKLVVACGALGLIAGVVGLFRTANSPANDGVILHSSNNRLSASSRRPYWTLAIAILTAFFALASLIYSTLAESASSIFLYTDFTSSSQSFTRESWTCQLATYYPDDAWSDLAGTCREARVGRWLLVPLIAALSYQSWHTLVASRTKQSHDRGPMELSPFDSRAARDDAKSVGSDEDEGA